jgi:hypothetical protein
MAVNGIKNNLAYGFNNPLQNLSPLPIISKRAPLATDIGEFGQQWIYSNNVWEYTSKGTWTQLLTSGSISPNAYVVTAPSITLSPTAGALSVVSNKTSQSATFTAVNNAMVGTAVLTGNTLAESASQVITLTNSNITLTGGFLYSITSTNVSTNGAGIQVLHAVQSAGSIAIDVTNDGSGNLATTDSIIISFMVLS